MKSAYGTAFGSFNTQVSAAALQYWTLRMTTFGQCSGGNTQRRYREEREEKEVATLPVSAEATESEGFF